MANERSLPSSPEAEETILGLIFLDNRLMDEAATIQPDRFAVPSNRDVFCAMVEMHEQRSEITPVLVHNILKRQGRAQQAGGLAGISGLAHGLPSVVNLRSYTRVLEEKWMLRQSIREASRIIEQAYEEDTADNVVTQASENFSALKGKMAVNGHKGGSIAEIGEQVIDYLYTVQAGINPAIPTAFGTLNQLTGGGIQQGEMRGVAALSSRGKTAMLLQDLRHTAKLGDPCILFSLEMKSLFIALRCLGAETGVPINRIRVGMKESEINWLVEEVKKHFTYPLYIYTDCRSVQDIHARIRSFKRKYPEKKLKRVGIDYYGKLSGYGRGRDRYENRTQELKYIADYLQQDIAIGENVGLDVPAQFNRSAWGLQDPGPGNIDGGEAYFQACDLFAVLQTNTDKAKPGDVLVAATLAVHKQRNGPTAMGKEKLKYQFHREKMEFYPCVEDEGEPDTPDEPERENPYL